MEDIYKKLVEINTEENVLKNEPMKNHTTFRTGGAADYFVTVYSEVTLQENLKLLKEETISYYIIGNGSNLLFEDAGFRGVILKMGRCENITVEGNRIYAGAGELLSKVANTAYSYGLTGMEFAAGIPGTIGGAVVMNAGAYGGEIKDIIVSAKALDEEGNLIFLTREELDLSYRHSIASERNIIIIGAEFELKQGDKCAIKAAMEELALRRKEKQPLEYPSAGSTFKRPEGYFAGKLIQDAGLKGKCVGGAAISEKHSGFVINKGNATTADILQLVKEVQEEVLKQSGVMLEMEIKTVSSRES